MEFSAFRLVIYVIVLVLVVYFILTYLAPFFFPIEDPLETIKDDLDDAQFKLGQTISSQVRFAPGSSLNARLLDTSLRSVNFECNEPSLCCEKKDPCGRIEWDERNVIFAGLQTINASSRCQSVAGLYACTVYFGLKPAQLEITQFPSDMTVDLESKELYPVSVVIKNTGEKIATGEINNTYKVYQVFKTQEGEQKIFQFELNQTVKNIYPGEEETIDFVLPRGEFLFEGQYLWEFKAESASAGFEEASFRTEIENVASPCQATQAEEPRLVAGQCQKKLNCQDCSLASACANVWSVKLGKELPLVDPTYTIEELPASQCQP
jgi:hypothetical protein